MIDEAGLAALSMRKLADRVGVSRTALYHYFEGKDALLCSIAEEGFELYDKALTQVSKDDVLNQHERAVGYVERYVNFSVEHASYYELMFGKTIWKESKASASLLQTSRTSFKRFVGIVEHWQDEGLVAKDDSPMRKAQVIWAALHGLSRFMIDGVYIDRQSRAEMVQSMAKWLLHEAK